MFANPQARPAHPERDAIMTTPQPSSSSAQLPPPSAPARAGTGLGVAALVLGVASLVAAVSFTLFPLGLLGGLAAAVLGGVAVTRARSSGTASSGAVSGIVCGVLALAVAVAFTINFGVLVARNTSVFTTFDSCIAKAGNRSAVVNCITHLANGIRP